VCCCKYEDNKVVTKFLQGYFKKQWMENRERP
jgi:hypothetical protein